MSLRRYGDAVLPAGSSYGAIYVFHPEVLPVNTELLPKVHSLDVSLRHFPVVMLETLLMASLFYFRHREAVRQKKARQWHRPSGRSQGCAVNLSLGRLRFCFLI